MPIRVSPIDVSPPKIRVVGAEDIYLSLSVYSNIL